MQRTAATLLAEAELGGGGGRGEEDAASAKLPPPMIKGNYERATPACLMNVGGRGTVAGRVGSHAAIPVQQGTALAGWLGYDVVAPCGFRAIHAT